MPLNVSTSSPSAKQTLPSMTSGVALPDNERGKRAAVNIEKEATCQAYKRPRAAYACLPCRARKVRCNVAESSPCLNCRLDHLQCRVQENRSRKWKKRLAASNGTNALKESTSPRKDKLSACEFSPTSRCRAKFPTRKRDSVSTCTDAECLPDSGIDSDIPCFTNKWPRKSYVQSSAQCEDGVINQFLTTLGVQDSIAQLPPFLRPLPDNMKPDAIHYLQKMQALDLPTVSLQNSLLRAFIDYVQPSMPLMNLHNFLNTVHYRHGCNGQLSLLLYQSVMFAATAFVDMEALCQAGYRTRKEAREKFFQKARLLYDFDYEHDGLVLVQSLLLMTYWDESPNDLKGTWYWMHIAVSYCYRIRLHHQSGCGVATTPISEQRLRRRLWWCCYMRDRVIALGMRQSPIIDGDSFDVPMLLESDFEIEDLAQSSIIAQLNLTVLQDLEMQQELAMTCIETAKLCIPIGQMLRARYSIRCINQPRSCQVIGMLRSALQTWATSLPDNLQEYYAIAPDAQGGRSTIIMQRTMLHMLYQTAIWVLHYSEYSLSFGDRGLSSTFLCHDTASFYWRIARGAASHVSQMIINLHRLRLDRFLTSTAVPLMTPAIVLHLAEVETGITPSRGLEQCFLVIEQLRDVYTITDQVSSFINAVLTRPANDLDLSCNHHIIQTLKNELSAALNAQEADSKSTQSAQNILDDTVPFSTQELFAISPLLEESPFTEQIATPGDVSINTITSLNSTDNYVDLDWKQTDDGEFWL